MIQTIKGDMHENVLQRFDGIVDDENEYTTWVEYFHEGEMVHRSVHVQLKQAGAIGAALAGDF